MADLWNMVRVTLLGSRNQGRGGASFDPARDIPSLAGKVVLITGAAGDIGRVTATALARHGRPARIYVADLPPRDEILKQELIERITRDAYEESSPAEKDKTRAEIRFLDLDLSSFESIRQCAAKFAAQEERLDMLILNAGIIRIAHGVTQQGYETHFGINYVGHALLIKLLTPIVLRTSKEQQKVRIVIVSSEGHLMAPKGGIVFGKLKTACVDMSYTQRYGQSKLALIHLTRQLAQLHPQVETVTVHPGRVRTGMGTALGKESLLVRLAEPLGPLLTVSPIAGARNHLWAATSPDVVSGKYYTPVGVPDREGDLARDDDLRRKVWEWTENELKEVEAIE